MKIPLLSPALGLAVISVLLFTTGCQTVSTSTKEALGGPKFPPSDPAQVQILHTEPTRPHVRLGEIRAEPSTESVPAVKIEDALRTAAAKLGADAAVVVYDQMQITGAYVTGPYWGRTAGTFQGRIIIAVAIKYQ
jgi:hypothetical protein